MEEPFILGDKRHRFIWQLLNSWDRVLCDYDDGVESETPYYFGERTNIGILAMAAERIGGFTFEAYSTEKGHKADLYSGRGDLKIQDSNENMWDFEAKHIWTPFIEHKDLKAKVEECLLDAIEDVDAHMSTDANKVGIVFLAPYIESKRMYTENVKRYEERIEQFKTDLCDIYSELKSGEVEGSHSVAAHFCTQDKMKRMRVQNRRGVYEYYPGIAVICNFRQIRKLSLQ